MKKSELCYAVWSWGGDREQIELAAKEISEIGYKKFETTQSAIRTFNFDAEEFKKLLERYSLTAESFYFITPKYGEEEPFFADLERELEFVSKIGAKRVTMQPVWGRPQNDVLSEEEKQHCLSVIKRFSDAAKKYGLKTGLHPHVNTYCMYEEEIDHVMNNLGPDVVGLVPDTAHMAAAGADPLRVMRKYADRICFTHLKDYKFSDEEPLKAWAGSDFHVSACFYELGLGVLAVDEMAKILESVNYDGPLCIELDRTRTTNAESARISYAPLGKFLED